MAYGGLIYLIIMGILDCWIGIILYIIAMVNKSNKLFLTGLIIQMLLNVGNLLGSSAISGVMVDAISSMVFFIIFSIITYLVINRRK
ncbi:MAG: hypothetical protein IJN99_01250 [Clostridia bacterium]|nr:hypothetical protein [Clostridia bacterium]